MKRFRNPLFLSLAVCLLVFSLGIVGAQTCDDSQTIFRLSDESNAHGEFWNGNTTLMPFRKNPDIYEDNVVWKSEKNGETIVYVKNLNTSEETQLISVNGDEMVGGVDISGNKIVWDRGTIHNREIYVYDLSSGVESQITDGTGNKNQAVISGEKIVWQDSRNGNSDIYMHDLSSGVESQITTDTAHQFAPHIEGNRIVWEDLRLGESRIYMWDLSSGVESQISNGPGEADLRPRVYENFAVWVGSEDKIHLKNVISGVESIIYEEENSPYAPAIHDDKVVWVTYSNAMNYVKMYDLGTGLITNISIGTNWQSFEEPEIYENKIVWTGKIHEADSSTDIYIYDVGTGEETLLSTLNAAYSVEICHVDIYGFLGDGNHECSDLDGDGTIDNLILNLNANTNAHGSINANGSYTEQVCYGSLECEARDISVSCAVAEEEIARMVCDADGSNCHMGTADSNYSVEGYSNYRICCGGKDIRNAQWQNMISDPINSSQYNDYVLMHVDTPGFNGQFVSFEVWENDGWLGNDDLTSFVNNQNPLVDITNYEIQNGKAEFYFELDETGLEGLANDGWDCANNGSLELYFKLSATDNDTGLSYESESEVLEVYCSSHNEAPIAEITHPVDGEIYVEGHEYNIELSEDSTDVDGLIMNWEWTITQSGTVLVSESIVRNNTYSEIDGQTIGESVTFSEGFAVVKLVVTDDDGAQDSQEIILNIGVETANGSVYVAGAAIDVLKAVEDVVAWENNGEVNFSGNRSFALEYDGNCNLICQAGTCPDETIINIPDMGSCSSVSYSNLGEPLDGVDFQWIFQDVESGEDGEGKSFMTYFFGADNPNTMDNILSKLGISFGASSGNTEKTFTLGQCIDGGNTYLEFVNGSIVQHDTTQEPNYCNRGPYGTVFAGGCCPSTHWCDEDASMGPICRETWSGCAGADCGNGECEGGDEVCDDNDSLIIDPEYWECEYYNDSVSCNDDQYGFARHDEGFGGLNCGVNNESQQLSNGVEECTWNAEGNNGSGSCGISLPCIEPEGPDGGCIYTQCTYEYTAGACDASGYMNVTYNAGTCQADADFCEEDYCTVSYETDCPSSTKLVPCGGNNFELGFFEYVHFFAVSIIISLIYLSIYWRKKENNE